MDFEPPIGDRMCSKSAGSPTLSGMQVSLMFDFFNNFDRLLFYFDTILTCLSAQLGVSTACTNSRNYHCQNIYQNMSKVFTEEFLTTD